MKQIILIILGGINIILCLGLYGIYYYENYYKDETINEIFEETSFEENLKEDDTFYVDIKGAVNNPGVYKVSSKQIVSDVVSLAGGLKKGAYTGNINLAKTLEKEMVINIYTLSEFQSLKEEGKVKKTSYDASLYEKASNENNSNNNQNGLININSATKEELMNLTGIGEAKAENIITYRKENGSFTSIEDIKNVSGISEKIYEDIKNSITV